MKINEGVNEFKEIIFGGYVSGINNFPSLQFGILYSTNGAGFKYSY
jgi:hypothetical protein